MRRISEGSQVEGPSRLKTNPLPRLAGLTPPLSVVFDLDGILVDTEPVFEEAARRQLARRGLVWVPAVARAMMGTPARQAFEFFQRHYDLHEPIHDLIAESSELFYAVLDGRPPTLMPGVHDLLDRLERRCLRKAIATSSNAAYVLKVLDPHGLSQRFEFVLTCDDVRLGKPHPEVYEQAAARLGHAPAEMVVIEDSMHGVAAAKAAGARCVAIPHARVRSEDLALADLIVESLEAPRLHEMLGV
jgi:HAD superfamily hydrolase (TIGR01509 family)